VRATVRVLLVLAGAVGFCAVLGTVASADVVNPESAMTLAEKAMVQPDQEQQAKGDEGTAPSAEPKPAPSAAPKDAPLEEAQASGEVAATPAPEQQVRQAPSQITRTHPANAVESSPLDIAVRPLRAGVQQVGSYLERVVSACQVGMGSGTGGPVVVLAVLGLVAALERRRILGVRSTTDEDVPEFLYAGEITPPG
jgi:hypothetical protein